MGFSGLFAATTVVAFMWGLGKQVQAQHWQAQAEMNEAKLQRANETISSVRTQLIRLQRANTTHQTEQDTTLKATIQNVFNALYNYDNKTYVTRFQQVKDEMTPNVFAKFEGTAGSLKSPPMPVKSMVKKLDIYLTSNTPTSAHALVDLTTSYAVGHAALAPHTQIFQLSLSKDSGQWKITNATVLGTFQPVNNP
ncbi:MAG: hypothetical protein K6T87_04335 [Roseiflexus sp.]|uniref:hypothetical protein n=1 Tax=Roseiflexus sp. TaxID=2562120 RepID=UPI0025EC1A42|nr:hypothetical protein [Roseiflexus sp.]MCL6539809.1 hypothetical protein [Roseiflexus sp.]